MFISRPLHKFTFLFLKWKSVMPWKPYVVTKKGYQKYFFCKIHSWINPFLLKSKVLGLGPCLKRTPLQHLASQMFDRVLKYSAIRGIFHLVRYIVKLRCISNPVKHLWWRFLDRFYIDSSQLNANSRRDCKLTLHRWLLFQFTPPSLCVHWW